MPSDGSRGGVKVVWRNRTFAAFGRTGVRNLCRFGVMLIGLLIASVISTKGQGTEKRTADTPEASSPSKHPLTYLSLVIRLKAQDPMPKILKANQGEGRLISPQIPSTTVYEVTSNGKSHMIGFLAEDPLAQRSFRSSTSSTEDGGKANFATVLLNIPKTDLSSAATGKIGIKFYKIQGGFESDMSSEKLKALANEGHAILQFELPPESLAQQITVLRGK